jgi:hypothetical protein
LHHIVSHSSVGFIWAQFIFKPPRKAVHRAYAKHAEVTVPSLDDWEKEWGKNSQRSVQPKLLPLDFRSPLAAVAQ